MLKRLRDWIFGENEQTNKPVSENDDFTEINKDSVEETVATKENDQPDIEYKKEPYRRTDQKD